MTSEQLALAYYNACMAELQALKPGNVHIFADGHGMTVHDFIKSAEASAEVIAQPHLSVGERILYAVEATQKTVGLNTNLGIILLCAPMIHAALQFDENQSLQQRLQSTLNALSVADAQLASQAIVLANPAGLGSAPQHDVHQAANVTLLEMMISAQHQDCIAWQYANAFSDVIDYGAPQYLKAMRQWQNPAWATTALYLGFLAKNVDTHVIRKHNKALAMAIVAEAQEIQANYWQAASPKRIQTKLLAWDTSLKHRHINPGTSADLTVASLLLANMDAESSCSVLARNL